MLAEIATPTPVRRYPLVDLELRHQLGLVWFDESKRESMPRCNCGWTGTARRPEVLGAVEASIAEYEGHLVGSR